MISAVFITFKKGFDPHKLRSHLTPKVFFFDTFQKLPSGNTGPTHTVTHTTNCAERFKEHRRGNCFLSGALLASGTYRICAMKLPIFSAAFCCICRVAWVQRVILHRKKILIASPTNHLMLTRRTLTVFVTIYGLANRKLGGEEKENHRF